MKLFSPLKNVFQGRVSKGTDNSFRHARSLFDDGNYEEAGRICRRLLKKEPDPRVYALLSQILLVTKHLDEALENIDKAIAINPEAVSFLKKKMLLLRKLGRFDEALALYQSALRKNIFSIGMLRNISPIRKFSNNDSKEIAFYESLFQKEISVPERINLNFSLGKIYDDCGNFEKAFSHYSDANSLLSDNKKRDASLGSEKYATELIDHCTKDVIDSMEHGGKSQVKPVFIVGMPRSGSTLIEQILASHPEAGSIGENNYFKDLCIRICKASGSKGVCPDYLRSLDARNTEEYQDEYLHLMKKQQPGKKIIINKYPFNYYFMGLIILLFPDCRIIYCRRHPLDICLSNYFSSFAAGTNAFANDLMDIMKMTVDCERLMQHWASIVPESITVLRYEDLIASPEEQIRNMLDALDLESHENCLRHSSFGTRTIDTASAWQARQPIYSTSVNRWKNYIDYMRPELLDLYLQHFSDLYGDLPAHVNNI